MADYSFIANPRQVSVNTLAHYWQPPSASEMMQVAAFGDAQQARMIQNKIAQMKLQEEQENQGFSTQMGNALANIDQSQPVTQTSYGPVNTAAYNALAKQYPRQGAAEAQARNALAIQQRMQQEKALYDGAVKMMESDDPDTAERGYSIIRQVAQGYRLPLPEKLGDTSAYNEFSDKLQGIINDPKLTLPQKLQQVGVAALGAQGKKQQAAGKTALETLKGLSTAEKTQSDEQLVAKSLEEKLGRKPTATEILNGVNQLKKERVQVGVNVRNSGNVTADDFQSWSPEEKKWHFDQSVANPAYKPDFGWGKSAADSRKAYQKELAQYAMGKGISGAEQQTQRASYAADSSALRDLRKREELIGTFVNRIDATSGVVEKLYKQVNNTDSRLINAPINYVKSTLGSGDWQALQLALTSLSNEIAKVESGSLGIAAVSVDQSKIMAKIHDGNLSLADMMKVIQAGKDLGKTSKGSIRTQVTDLEKRMAGKETETKPETPGAKAWKQKNGVWVQE